MKRYIRANRNEDEMSRRLDDIAECARALADVAEAETDEEILSILKTVVPSAKPKSKAGAIQSLMHVIEYPVSEYLLAYNRERMRPTVIKDVLACLEDAGLSPEKMQTAPSGYDESYLLVPAEELEWTDLKVAASAVAREFGIKPDTGVIGGSWTSYEFKLEGCPFRIGIAEDLDADPSGKTRSLQFYL